MSRPGNCGTGPTIIDYLAGSGWETPGEAVREFVDGEAKRERTDAKGLAERAAVIASASILRDEGIVFAGHRQYAARDEEGVLAIYWVFPLEPNAYVVDSYWVRLPAELCPPPG